MKYKGHIAWKSAIEHNPEGRIHGTPYFIITGEDDQIYFYEYDVASQQYVLLMQSDSSHFSEWHDIGLDKEEALRQELRQRGELFTIEWEPEK